MLESNKPLHLLQIATAGVMGLYGELMLSIPTPTEMVSYIQLGAQVLIALVTCWATIRKAFQKPVAVVAAAATSATAAAAVAAVTAADDVPTN